MRKAIHTITVFLHPFLFSFFPGLFLYAHNLDQVQLIDLLIPFFLTFLISLFIVQVCLVIYKSTEKSVLIASFILLFSFSLGRCFDIMVKLDLPVFISSYYFLLFFIVLFIGWNIFILKILSYLSLLKFNKILNFIATTLTIISIFNIAINIINSKYNNYKTQQPRKPTLSVPFKGDIYYIILDGYDSQKTSADIFNVNNDAFFNTLSKKGFLMPKNPKSNYSITFLSITSSLNMSHLKTLIPNEIGTNSNSNTSLYNLIQDNEVVAFLKDYGIKFINISSGWGPTSYNGFADVNSNYFYMSYFLQEWAQGTCLRLLSNRILYANRYKCILNGFKALKQAHKIEGQKFILSHIVCPHPPYIFNENSTFAVDETLTNVSPKEKYFNQLKFVNKEILKCIDTILKSSHYPPIIVLQSDHGSDLLFENSFLKLSTDKNLRDKQLEDRLSILNAYYLPGFKNNKQLESITPVNTFRFIFNQYFLKKIPLTDNKSYFSNYYQQFKLSEFSGKK